MDAVCQLYEADCLEVLAGIPADSFDACVTDPPYELSFMSKRWDATGVAFDPDTWRAIYRVLKPGGHMLVFGGTRTQHRMVCAIEDAGFEIRDTVLWLYGTGFNKVGYIKNVDGSHVIQGWGGTLKPAVEMICLARKPLSEKTVAANVLRWGCGALNVDGCRVQGMKDIPASPSGTRAAEGYGMAGNREGTSGFDANVGRWPANIVHDGSDEVEAAFAVFGDKGGGFGKRGAGGQHGMYSPIGGTMQEVGFGDAGNASRFFYQAKASKHDRADSRHPTVKPLALMRYLCKLITPPGGTILDPFAGSGTTGEAALDEGFSVTLIEREAEYCQDIRKRIG